jgi:alpha-galactosidase
MPGETTIGVISSASAQGNSVLAPPSATSISIPISLTAASDNSVRVSISPLATISSATLTPPTGLYYPATSFSLHGNADLTICPAGTCVPVGSKIGNLSPNGSAAITIQNPHKSAVSGPKYISVDYTNNDVAIADSWTNGTNTRNLTVGINGDAPTRLELPLAGRSSELFSVGKGWDDSSTFGVLIGGLDGENGKAEVVIGNVGGADGIQPMGAEFVGMRVFW